MQEGLSLWGTVSSAIGEKEEWLRKQNFKKLKFRSILNCLQQDMNDQGNQYKIKWHEKSVKLFSRKWSQVLPEMSVNVWITPFWGECITVEQCNCFGFCCSLISWIKITYHATGLYCLEFFSKFYLEAGCISMKKQNQGEDAILLTVRTSDCLCLN